MMKAGAHEYLIRKHRVRLAPAVERESGGETAGAQEGQRRVAENPLIAAEEANHRYH